MEAILESYKDRLDEEISKRKSEIIGSESRFDILVEKVRDDLSDIGKRLLADFYDELVKYVEENKKDFIENNKDKWEEILERANSLKEYGLYVAPVELLKEENNTIPILVGVGTFTTTSIVSKLIFKKFKFISSALVGVAAYFGYSHLFGEDKGKKREMLLEYVNDAQDWIETALDNMYKIFQDAFV